MTDAATLDRPSRESSQKLDTARLRDLSRRRLFPWLSGRHQMWMALPSTANAASMTASLSVGGPWTIRATSV